MKKKWGILALSSFSVIFCGCAKSQPLLEGCYQSDMVNGYCVQMTIEKEQKEFRQFINNREVQKGTYEDLRDNTYHFDGNRKDFTVTLSDQNTFELVIQKLNDEKPIYMEQVGKVPVYFDDDFEDVAEYQKLLE